MKPNLDLLANKALVLPTLEVRLLGDILVVDIPVVAVVAVAVVVDLVFPGLDARFMYPM